MIMTLWVALSSDVKCFLHSIAMILCQYKAPPACMWFNCLESYQKSIQGTFDGHESNRKGVAIKSGKKTNSSNHFFSLNS